MGCEFVSFNPAAASFPRLGPHARRPRGSPDRPPGCLSRKAGLHLRRGREEERRNGEKEQETSGDATCQRRSSRGATGVMHSGPWSCEPGKGGPADTLILTCSAHIMFRIFSCNLPGAFRIMASLNRNAPFERACIEPATLRVTRDAVFNTLCHTEFFLMGQNRRGKVGWRSFIGWFWGRKDKLSIMERPF